MNYDIGIIGAGVSGVFAALRLAEKHKHLKVVVFEFGPPPPNCLREDPVRIKRRRRQLEGWLGCFPTGDGKIYLEEDTNTVLEVVDGRRIRSVKSWFESQLAEISPQKIVKNKSPNPQVIKAIENSGFNFTLHNFEQWIPDQIHNLAKTLADKIEEAGNVHLCFDTEVYNFMKDGKSFSIYTSQGDFKCKRVILSVGRSGWRWVNENYKKLGILQNSNTVKYGIRVEMPSSTLKDFQRSHCSFSKPELEVGPMSWMGSIIQEDHDDMTIASFRSNEDRWKTDKVFFSIKRKIQIDTDPCSYLDRIAKLSHLLSGDRVGREKIKTFLQGFGDLTQMPEYNWIQSTLRELESIFPNIINRGYFHIPDIDTNVNTINIANNLETEIDGLFVTGECAGIKGIAAAGITGAAAAEGVAK
jgi:hypothetical protein